MQSRSISALHRASAESEIHRTIAAYAHLLDDGRFPEWGELFTPTARFVVSGRTHEGPEAIRAEIEAIQGPDRRGKHLLANTLISVDSPEGARAWTDYLFVALDRSITVIGRYHDELVPIPDGRWRFAIREIVLQGELPNLTALPEW